MSLREQILTCGPAPKSNILPSPVAPYIAPAPVEQPASSDSAGARGAHHRLKKQIHQTIIDRVELDKLHRLPADQVRAELAQLIGGIAEEEKILLNELERKRLIQEVQDEMMGLGPLEPLLKDPTISDILVNTSQKIYVERRGKLQLTDTTFYDDAHLMQVIERIVSRVGRRIDESTTMVDARLPDGSRVNAVVPPSAIDGPLLSIRRFPAKPLTIADMVNNQSMTAMMAQLFEAASKAKLNILISGGTGSGKTTLLNLMSSFIPSGERIVTIEDAAELQLQQGHVLRLETRPPNIEGKGEVSQQSLLRNALRMRPDRIVLGEVRGAEALDMLSAMNSGHEGSLATLHANTPRDALTRLENMVSMAGLNMPTKGIRYQIASAITLVVQMSRLSDGRRKVVSVQEITGMEGDIISMQEIYAFTRTGVDAQGNVTGYFSASGMHPKFCERLVAHGIPIPEGMFDATRHVEV